MNDARRAVTANRRIDLDHAGDRPTSADPYMYGPLARFRFDAQTIRHEIGVIMDVIPGGYAYLVSASHQSNVWCSPGGTSGGFGVLGARPLHTYQLGSVVFFARDPTNPAIGTIISAIPHWYAHTANQPSSPLWPFLRAGQFVEPAHQYPLIRTAIDSGKGENPLGAAEGADLSSGRIYDATTAGEWGAVTETGTGVFVDPFQAFIRVDEATGVFCFHADQLTRVAGHNFQQFTSLTEREQLEDEGELAGWSRSCVYPWEHMGLWRYNQVTSGWLTTFVTNHGLQAGQGTAFTNPYAVMNGSGYAPREPEIAGQLPAARIYSWDGYLGQGGDRTLAAPAQIDWAYPSVPDEALTAEVEAATLPTAPAGRLSVDGETEADTQPFAVPPNSRSGPSQPGLLREHITLPGDYHLQVAHRYAVVKRCSIPTPRPVKRQEDPGGDSSLSGYAASGLNGNAVEHSVLGGFTASAGAPHRSVLLPDAVAYMFNWENLHPFVYHEEDWSVAEEGAAGWTAVNQQPPDYEDLELAQYLDTPDPKYLDIDHRYGLVQYFENEAGFIIWEDGSIDLYDGWGSQIRMGGGNIDIRAAGDITLSAGRNIIGWAGHDVNLKAHDTVDVAAVNGDMFFRSENKFHAVAGNSGYGGFLFETKATCPIFDFTDKVGAATYSSGFVVLAPESPFIVLAQDAVIKLTDTTSDGRIVLDAGTSRQIHTISRNVVHRITEGGSIIHLFDGTLAPSANEFTEDYAFLGNRLTVHGAVYATGCITSAQWVVAGSHFASAQADDYHNVVQQYAVDTTTPDSEAAARFSYLTDTYADLFVAQTFYPDGVDDAEFTHRNNEQYRTDDYVYWESRWQTIADNDGQTLWPWTETPVIGLRSTEETHAHPGERRTESGSYKYLDPSLTDPAAGWTAISRATNLAAYEAAAPNAPSSSDIDSTLKVTTPPG